MSLKEKAKEHGDNLQRFQAVWDAVPGGVRALIWSALSGGLLALGGWRTAVMSHLDPATVWGVALSSGAVGFLLYLRGLESKASRNRNALPVVVEAPIVPPSEPPDITIEHYGGSTVTLIVTNKGGEARFRCLAQFILAESTPHITRHHPYRAMWVVQPPSNYHDAATIPRNKNGTIELFDWISHLGPTYVQARGDFAIVQSWTPPAKYLSYANQGCFESLGPIQLSVAITADGHESFKERRIYKVVWDGTRHDFSVALV